MRKIFILALMITPIIFAVSCSKAEFDLSAANRTTHIIFLWINAKGMGEIQPGKVKAFPSEVTKIQYPYYGGTAPTATAEVTFQAQDIHTGKLSRKMVFTLSKDRPFTVEFVPTDFQ